MLLVNYYGSCVGCPCRRYDEETNEAKCYVKQSIIEEGVKKPDWCPLKAIPKRRGDNSGSKEYNNGWNDAIDNIELG